MATKLVNGVQVQMSPAELAEFEESRAITVGQARIEKRRQIIEAWALADSKEVSFDKDGNLNAYYAQTLVNARLLKDALAAATTVAEIQAIDHKAGW